MKRATFLLFSGLAYAFFLLTFVALIGFVAGGNLSPLSVDRGEAVSPLVASIWDLGLIALFGLQHSVMARPGFKDRWTKLVPASLERSIFVVAASAALWIMYLLWKPVPLVVWSVEQPALAGVLWAVFGLGWLIVLASTFLIDHFELFGLRQALAFARKRAPRDPAFVTPFLYRIVRHPLYAGFLLAFWANPRMTVGHFVFAAGMTAYVLVAIVYEERDLVATFGDSYRRYQADVDKLVPRRLI